MLEASQQWSSITGWVLTEAVKHIKETYQHHRGNIDSKAEAAQVERSGRDVPPSRHDIWSNSQNERHGAQNNKRAN